LTFSEFVLPLKVPSHTSIPRSDIMYVMNISFPTYIQSKKMPEGPLGKKISTLRADLGKNIRTWRFFENIDKICDFLKLFMKDLEFLKDYSLKLQ
jgi:hypothetical protein